jgi:molybdate transport system substrate-binding protein
VLAAADLQRVLPQIAAAWQARTGHRVEIVFGSTGNLTTQVENGAPGDLFLSASERFVDRLERGGHVVPETRAVYAEGRLALVWRAGAPAPAGPAALAGEAYRTVAIANPEHAPYGEAARQVLEGAGAWAAVRGRLVLAENVAQALQFVRSGNADAGISALGIVIDDAAVPHRPVDPALHAPLRQTGAVLRASARPDLAADLLRELTGPRGREAFLRHGFGAPVSP